MIMSGMGYGNMTCASLNDWMIPSAPEPWTKAPTDGSANIVRRNIAEVVTSKTSDMYDRGVISSTSPPMMAPESSQGHSRLRSLLTKAKAPLRNALPPRNDTHQEKEILKGLLKGQPATNNSESNFLLKGLLNSGVMHQDDSLLNSLGFVGVRSPPSCNPSSPQTATSPVFSTVCELSPQSYDSPSPTGSSKRSGCDDIYIEHQIIKKKCYSPPAFHSLPSSSVPANSKDGGNASAICEKNKMLASLLATQATTPATIPPLPQSVITATPQERLPKVPGRTRQNSSALWSGGTIKLNEPVSPPVDTSPKLDKCSPPVKTSTLMQHQETYPVNTRTRTPLLAPSSPESENCYPNPQPRNRMFDQRAYALNQQRSYPCNQEGTWPNYCGQPNQLPSTGAQDNSEWQKQITAQGKLSFQSQEDAVSCSNSYNCSVSTSQYNPNYYSSDYYSQLPMRRSQDNNNVEQYAVQQQQMLLQQQQLTQQNYQQRCCSQQKEYFNMQSQQSHQQQMAAWNGYIRGQAPSTTYNNFQEMKQSEALRQHLRGVNYHESGNSYQEFWDLQNSDSQPTSRVQTAMEYQHRGETNIDRKYMSENAVCSTMVRELPSRLSESDDVPNKCHRLKSGGPNDLQQEKNFMTNNDELPVLGQIDNDLSWILDDFLDEENLDKHGQDPRRLQRNNLLPVPNNGPTRHPSMFSHNNYSNYDARSCV